LQGFEIIELIIHVLKTKTKHTSEIPYFQQNSQCKINSPY